MIETGFFKIALQKVERVDVKLRFCYPIFHFSIFFFAKLVFISILI